MAFQQMLSGAECAAPNNLRQFMKHTQTDRTLQQDTMQPGRPAANTFRTANIGGGAAPEMDAFMQRGAPGFDMSGMRGEMDAIRGGMVARPTGPSGSAWASEMRTAPAPAPAQAQAAGGWSEQFAARPVGPVGPAQAGSAGPMREAHAARMHMPMMGMGMGMSGMGVGMGMRSSVAPPREVIAPGGQRVYELDDEQWEEQFKRLEEEDVQSKGKEKDKAETDDEARLREFRERLFGDEKDPNPRFEELWQTLKDEEAMLGRNHLDELAKWEQQLVDAIRDDDPTAAYSHPGGGIGLGADAIRESAGIDGTEDRLRKMFTEVGEDGFPKLDEYKPQAKNPYAANPSPFAEGMRLMENNGSLSEAALLFEAAVQQDQQQRPEGLELDNAERSRVWQKLGECQAMNEHEMAAIQALEKAVELDANNLEAYVSLAVSYINDGYDLAAHTTLLRLLARSHPHIASSGEFPALPDQDTNPWARLNYVRDLYLRAAREDAAEGRMDPDVQVALGILFYSSSSYDQAVDCFEAALKVRPDDWSLWNRLGATLANGGKPEMAIDAYQRALELRPSFTRAIYNLSVSCLNLGAHHEAAEHLLTALSMQRSQPIPELPDAERANIIQQNPGESEDLWKTLRSTLVLMDRFELAALCNPGQSFEPFRKAGFEF
ncbi:Peroxisomal membrane signal receptor PTS1 [Malassezia cuniculi]|uniref:Peroxisomal membrane signal receptor PTS1 n=1 Tax=Malassezia cuniculi TaxID=948313 RepID=A0AAF0J700_9BASI|nr:Peroxisomal membrane signal receptor PTS1 [Malassezia cuniculi]